jgi:hypothetical protein
MYSNVQYETTRSRLNAMPAEASGAKLDDDITPF